jgi:SagB-type dehydrogenase family enzyme
MSTKGREFLKDEIRERVDFSQTAQSRGVPEPPWQKPAPAGSRLVSLASPGAWSLPDCGLQQAIARRRSHRRFRRQPLSLDELSFLLWAAQGLRETASARTNFRTVPSAGCRHALETYVAALRVQGLETALYRFLPHGHSLVEVARHDRLDGLLAEATFGQRFCGDAAVTIAWTAIPARMEWRYGEASYKVIALDAGHACQNLCLACEAVGCGACAVAAYDQARMDELLGVDGDEEFTMYLAPLGKVQNEPS